jgi:hypothetical protein
MIVAAAICPSPPLLASGITGQAEILPDLRAACAAAVARLLAAAPDVVAVTGPAESTAPFDPAGELSLASFAPALRLSENSPSRDNSKKRDAGPSAAAPALPLALGIGAMLLDEAGYQGPRTYDGIAEYESAAACLALGAKIAASAPRVALLAMGDGTARRSPSAPGYLDERAAPFDEAVERAVRAADLPALADLDPILAADLLAAGRPAWQSLAGALSATLDPGGDHPQAADQGTADHATDGLTAPAASAGHLAGPGPLRTEVLYSDAPLGVAYLVATLIPRPDESRIPPLSR